MTPAGIEPATSDL